ncbi:hypothetical protein MSSIT_1965 [Methanosarcina siciliae T4/M]|uniref:Uncharacterized protein n=1 Tax=Methanosarcina siciliae T4/M TaxID=1434120 RepID=A0A0E3P776_9EURY|nr:hypothetical protein [Methanosarcina siciliae]AKB28684.1 hypothetical protein MSSIT_1965 [Methanosarcina siciliae T4/M]
MLKSSDIQAKLFKEYKDRLDELLEVETLIINLKQLGCKGLDTKFESVDDNGKFKSTVSELKVAKLLLSNKHEVELLSEKDTCFKKKKGETYKSPDMICINDDSKICIEVTSLKNRTEFDDFLSILRSSDLTNRWVEVPAIGSKENFKNQQIYDKMKKENFYPELEKNPYIIAIEIHEWGINSEDIRKILYGSICCFCSNTMGTPEEDFEKLKRRNWENVNTEVQARDSWIKIQKAISKGWESFLSKYSLIPNSSNNSYIEEEGIFVLDKMDDVSAILILDHSNNCFFYPNPFCRDEINSPKIINFINMTEDAEV